MGRFERLLHKPVEKIREINHKYSTPRIKLSRSVKISLLLLRIYLLIIVVLLLFKLVTLLR
jgi:hypothetical protein